MVMPDQIMCAEPVQDEEIVMLRALMGNMSPYDPHFYLHDGMMVEVTWVANSGHPGDLVTKRKMPWSGAGSALDSEGDGGGD